MPKSEAGDASAAAAVIEVTDGWYRMAATIDRPLAELILCGRLKVGPFRGTWELRLRDDMC